MVAARSLPRWGAFLAGLLTLFILACGDDGAMSVPLSGEPPPVQDAGEPDPGGSADAAVLLPPRGRYFGFSGALFLHTGTGDPFDQGLTASRTARDALAVGANSARLEINWGALEPQRGSLNRQLLRRCKRFVAAFTARGGRVLIGLNGAPVWASAIPGDGTGSVANRDAALEGWSAYVKLVAKRFPRAAAFEVWNEPNATFAYKPKPDPATYVKLLRRAHEAVKEVAPKVPVIVGGLAANVPDTKEVITPQRFLKQLYQAGMTPGDYEGLALHPYPALDKGQAELTKGRFAAGLADFRAGFEWRDPSAPIWITETGYTTTGVGATTADQQAHGINALLRKLLSMPRIRGVYVHTQYDIPGQPATSPERGYGLMTSRRGRESVPKSAYCFLGVLLRKQLPLTGC